ncbi:hypothetical protein QFZ62_000045 [Clavibacter sp. B3I6]|uniref:hypothetical protein n=1 Tax=Clavibacter sp. B3I6 TaxID=3042268 RepID=UPI002782CB5B|nr:hypothetical protein [Clavibacter sp. B3I6]MDQ0742737.1 hypothetical protein [Clavibacter sp. B3I6]
MDEAEAIARAARLWQSGRRAAALESLRARVRRSPGDAEARRTLVGYYRELRAPDQAGRYALAIPGLATPAEQDRAARQFAAAGRGTAALPGYLALPGGDLPTEVLAFVIAVERHREQRRSAWAAAHAREQPEDDDLAFAVWALVGTSVALALLAGVVGALAGVPVTGFARWSALVVVVAVLVGCAVQWRRPIARALAR